MKVENPNLILDTPILLLYLVGSYDAAYINSFKRTHKYSKDDYEYISQIIERAKKIYITPQIIAEISNFSLEIDKSRIGAYMKVLIEKFNGYKEGYIKLDDLIKNEDLLCKIGFTDVSIIEASKKISDCLVLSDDFHFTQRANSVGCRVINFTELRGYNWFNN